MCSSIHQRYPHPNLPLLLLSAPFSFSVSSSQTVITTKTFNARPTLNSQLSSFPPDMHSSIHSLAHRAPPATRSRVRWQPYNALASASSSLSSRSPSISYISTPATSVTSSPPPKPAQLCDVERLKAHPSMPQTPRDPLNSLRESPKNKYATGLVDQAVKSLCEIWRPQDIPNVFLTSSRATVGSCSDPPPAPPQTRRRNTQLPSPVSPLTHPSPPSPPSAAALECSRTAAACDQDAFNRSNLVPIKGFVHEVLRRSRTSGSVLQTALCYLEAIRSKVPELIRKEQSGEGAQSEYDSESRVTPATAAELELEAQLSSLELSAACVAHSEEDVMDTVRVYDNEELASTATPFIGEAKIAGGPSTTSVAPLPSPLLCPRRAFLASLILASKFTQDKCYSNRAWAKLSGLPAREIGRCERALGDALDWRLWVGKTPVASHSSAPSPTTATTTPITNSRPVVRCRSEGTLPASKGAFLAPNDNREIANGKTVVSPISAQAPSLRGLRRCSTLPADAFAEKERTCEPCSAGSSTNGPSHHEATWIGEGHQLSFSNIAAQDELMGSPEFSLAIISPPSPTSTYDSYSSLSPIPSTPSLSYSPTSTESSSGDRTIQMSTFMDDNMAPLSHDVVICGNEWGPTSPIALSGTAFEAAALGSGNSAIYGYARELSLSGQITPSVANAWLWSDARASDYYTHAERLGEPLGAAAKFSGIPAKPAFPGAAALSGMVGDWHALEHKFTLGNLSAKNYASS
ncbi:hypothetical protein B0H12DRAFT_1229675 [Mycena haematopus]|nr:hypothetical protein B0H12DRAFT_1229675 [Mycena haematopus]